MVKSISLINFLFFVLFFTFFGKVCFSQAPTITSFTPAAQTQGGTVTITGTNFTGVTGTGSVKFGGTNATSFTVVNATTITAVVGAGTSGDITVTHPTNGTATSGSTFTFCGSVAQPGTITGTANVCGYSSLTYTIRKVANATSYTWTMGTGSSNIISSNNGPGPNDTSITVSFAPGFCTRDTIYVKAATACASSINRILPLVATYAPAQPASVANTNTLVCIGGTTSLIATAASPSATQSLTSRFRWTLPANISMVSANADSSIINISINSGFTGGNVTVKSQSACLVLSTNSTLHTISYSPAIPQSINSSTGSYAACIGSEISFTAIPGASSSSFRPTSKIRWTLPRGTQILSANADSTTIKLRFITGYTGGSLWATPVSSCGRTGSLKGVTLTAGTCPSAPSTITGLQELCPAFDPFTGFTSTLIYTVTPVPGITRYNWVLPPGATQVSGDTSNSIGVVFDTTVLSRYGQGRIYVGTVNASGIHSTTYSEIRIYKTKPVLGTISGPADVCPYIDKDSAITYSVPVTSNVTSYVWNVPAGVTIVSGQGTDTIQVKFTGSFVSGSSISVTALSNCGNYGPRNKLLQLSSTVRLPSAIRQSFSPLVAASSNVAGLTSLTVRIQKVTNAQSYQWRLSLGTNATISHPNGTGPNDTVVIINFLSGFTKDTIFVAAISSCNITSERKLGLTALTVPPGVTGISGEANPCRNSIHVFTASHAAPNSTQAPFDHFRWTTPASATIIGTNADSSVVTVQFDGTFVAGFLSAKSVSALGIVSPYYRSYRVLRVSTLCAPGSRLASKEISKQNDTYKLNNSFETEVFNNPTQKEFTIRFKSPSFEKIEWAISDMNGKNLLHQFSKPGEMIRFGSNFATGTYFLRSRQGLEISKTKLIKY